MRKKTPTTTSNLFKTCSIIRRRRNNRINDRRKNRRTMKMRRKRRRRMKMRRRRSKRRMKTICDQPETGCFNAAATHQQLKMFLRCEPCRSKPLTLDP